MHTSKLAAWKAGYAKLHEAQRKLLAAVEALDEVGIKRYADEVAKHGAACNEALRELNAALESQKSGFGKL